MAQYEVEFTIWGEYPDSYDGVCQVEFSDEEVQQIVTLMQEYNTSDAEKLELEDNLPEIYAKFCTACDKVAIDIVEKDWLDSAIYHLSDYDYDEDELISYCQEQYGCPKFNKGDEGNFNDWLRDFWKRATLKEQKDLCFGYMEFDKSELAEARCCVGEQYEITIPQSIVEMANIK